MARKRVDTGAVPEHSHEFEHEHRRGRAKRFVMLLALAGGAVYVIRRRQRRAELDEGVWHEAPTEAPTA